MIHTQRPGWSVTRVRSFALLFLLLWCGSSYSDEETRPLSSSLFVSAADYVLTLPNGLIALDSRKGRQYIAESMDYSTSFLPMMEHFLTQTNGAFCGVASSVIALNSLPINAPDAAPEHEDFHFYTETNIFENLHGKEKDLKNITYEYVSHHGLQLKQLGTLLGAVDEIDVTMLIHAEDEPRVEVGLELFRNLAKKVLSDPNERLLVNFERQMLGMGKVGHISPLSAYHAESDHFLLMDVARYKYPPFWVKAIDLYRAMATKDPGANENRGYVAIRHTNDPLPLDDTSELSGSSDTTEVEELMHRPKHTMEVNFDTFYLLLGIVVFVFGVACAITVNWLGHRIGYARCCSGVPFFRDFVRPTDLPRPPDMPTNRRPVNLHEMAASRRDEEAPNNTLIRPKTPETGDYGDMSSKAHVV